MKKFEVQNNFKPLSIKVIWVLPPERVKVLKALLEKFEEKTQMDRDILKQVDDSDEK